MTTWYVDTSQGSNGTGSFVNPYNTMASVVTVAGDTVLIKTGTTLTAIAGRNQFFPADLISKDNITIGEYGTGAKPIFDGSVLNVEGDFVADAPNSVWYLQYVSIPDSVGGTTNRMGNISEDGVKMKHYTFNTNIATTAALMVAGQYTIDFTNNRIYIKPTGGTITGRTYRTSNAISGIREDSVSATSGLTLRNLNFTRVSKHGGVLYNKTGFSFSGVDFEYIGGVYLNSTTQAGNGLELSYGCSIGTIENCSAVDIFDTGFTSQVYESGTATTNDILYDNLTISRCGLSAIELSAPTSTLNTFQTVKNVEIKNTTISDIAPSSSGATRWDYNWSGYRGGYAINLTNNGGATNKISGCNIHDVTITNAFRMVATKDTYGVNRFWNISGTNITDAVIASSTSTDGQVHQYTNVVDNSARTPSGIGKWQSATGIALPTRTILSR